MTPAARIASAAAILDDILAGTAAEKALTHWGRRNRFAGSGDRAALRDLVYDAMRRKRSAAALGGEMSGRGLMIGLIRGRGETPEDYFTGIGHAPAPLTDREGSAANAPVPGGEAMDLPDWILPEFNESLGQSADSVAATLQERAPIFLRVNTAKNTVDQAVEILSSSGVACAEVPEVNTALLVSEGARKIRNSAAYLDGLIELQDANSQAVCLSLPLEGVSRVLDFCAGGGGKSLAMAARHTAEYVVHDANPQRMKDIGARATRAGVTLTPLASEDLAQAGAFDLVLCDVPCSGSGAWRRAPEGKWTLDPEGLLALHRTQSDILDRATDLVAPGGSLAYITCSLLRSENHDQIDAFLARHPEWRCDAVQQWLPSDSGDGFFLAILTCDGENNAI